MKTLTLISQRHAFAYGVYGKQTFFGLALMLGATVQALEALIFIPIIGLLVFCGGLLGLLAISSTARAVNPEPGLRLEAVAVLWLGLTNLGITIAVYNYWGPFAAVLTLTYVGGVALSCAGRVWQIRHDLKKLRAAFVQARPADDATLAEPPDIEK